jgi:hypothetical protein
LGTACPILLEAFEERNHDALILSSASWHEAVRNRAVRCKAANADASATLFTADERRQRSSAAPLAAVEF